MCLSCLIDALTSIYLASPTRHAIAIVYLTRVTKRAQHTIFLINDYCGYILEEVQVSVCVNDGSFQFILEFLSVDFESLKDSFTNFDLLNIFFQLFDPCLFLFVLLMQSSYVVYISVHECRSSHSCCYIIFSNISHHGNMGENKDSCSFCYRYFLHLLLHNPTYCFVIAEAP
jgi:hypothetical protein